MNEVHFETTVISVCAWMQTVLLPTVIYMNDLVLVIKSICDFTSTGGQLYILF